MDIKTLNEHLGCFLNETNKEKQTVYRVTYYDGEEADEILGEEQLKEYAIKQAFWLFDYECDPTDEEALEELVANTSNKEEMKSLLLRINSLENNKDKIQITREEAKDILNLANFNITEFEVY